MPPIQSPAQRSHPEQTSTHPPHRPWIILVGICAAILGLAVAAYLWLGGREIGVAHRTEPLKVGIVQNVKHLDQVIDGFKQGLAEMGYEEGVDVVYEYQNANGDSAAAQRITEDYIAKRVDLILAVTEQAAKAVYAATEAAGVEIPIVFTNGLGMVETGFLKSYASSGTYVTGVVPDDVDVTIKKLEFLKQINPNAKKVGVFYSSLVPIYPAVASRQALAEQAPKLGLEIIEYDIKTMPGPASTEVMRSLANTIRPGDIDAIVTIPEVVSNYQDNPRVLLELSKRIKAPILFLTVPRVFEGGLLSYSQDYIVFGKQAAAQADRIFRGTHPSQIPIEFSVENRLIINLKTAKEMGLTIPESLLFNADQVIPAE
jgi:putative tryptophan/tyrosine transport system substrate-binding protein